MALSHLVWPFLQLEYALLNIGKVTFLKKLLWKSLEVVTNGKNDASSLSNGQGKADGLSTKWFPVFK